MTDVNSKPLAGYKTTARVLGTVITYRLVVPFLLAMTWYLLLSAFSNPLAGFKTTARVWGSVITRALTYRAFVIARNEAIQKEWHAGLLRSPQ
jgi:hypothetical protein